MTVIPIHAETIPDAPQAVRWVLPAALIPGRGDVIAAPEPLATLLNEGLVTLRCEASGIVVNLKEGESWRDWSEKVRQGLLTALAGPGQWRTAGTADLRTVVEEVLAGEVGAYVRSHGGQARLLFSDEERATIELTGTCAACPLRGITLEERIGAAVRAAYPGLVELKLAAPLWPRLRVRPGARRVEML